MIYTTCTDNCNGDVSQLLREWTGKEYSFAYILSNAHFVVARDEKRTIGCAQLSVMEDPFWNRKWGLVENVYVTPEYRRRGVARRIMEDILSVARAFDCEFVKLTSAHDKKEGHELYRALGYKEGLSFKKAVR